MKHTNDITNSDFLNETYKQLKEYYDSDIGKQSVEKYILELENEEKHIKRWVDRMWNHIQFNIDNSIEKLLIWYESDTYRNREYNMGYEPRESLLWVLMGVADKYGVKATQDEYNIYGNMFTGEIYRLGSYIIQVMHGQGSVIRIDKIT
jgi:hypothetical protein